MAQRAFTGHKTETICQRGKTHHGHQSSEIVLNANNLNLFFRSGNICTSTSMSIIDLRNCSFLSHLLSFFLHLPTNKRTSFLNLSLPSSHPISCVSSWVSVCACSSILFTCYVALVLFSFSWSMAALPS